jgi:hypothetical protein
VDVHQDVHLSEKGGDSSLVQNVVDVVLESLGFLGNLICAQGLEVDTDREALRVLRLNVGGGAEALELAFNHDTHLSAKGLCLFHAMGCQDNTRFLTFNTDVADQRPHEAFSLGINASARLVEKNNWRISKKGQAALKLSFVSS